MIDKAREGRQIANLIMVGVKYTDKYPPFPPNTYLFLVCDYENGNYNERIQI